MATLPIEPVVEEVVVEPTRPLAAIEILLQFADAEGDISQYLSDDQINRITDEVYSTYECDKTSREDWETVACKALKDMARSDWGQKNWPWPNSSNVHYPLLPFAVMQFNARAYPAIVKGDEAVSCKVVGSDKGMPIMGPDGQPLMQFNGAIISMGPEGPSVMTDQGPITIPPEQAQQVMENAQPVWKREPGAKGKRAQRVRDFMNYILFYKMDGWESETDTLLFQMPAIGCGFRKTWYDGQSHQSRFVPALKLVVNNEASSLETAPQITEEIDGIYPYQIKRDIRLGKYREIFMDPDDKDPRKLIEAQCYYDLDGDDLDEPYIVTIDCKSKELLRIVPDFGAEQVKLTDNAVAYIERRTFYTKYEFLPNPEGKFYNIGLAHLLDQYGNVINTLINQMIDANTAAIAGGGFIASGLRIQGQGQSSSLRWRPGEYKTVTATGGNVREAFIERTFPNAGPMSFNLLELILGAARDIASIKDVLSGDASNNGQVGTTLALIEQGLQVFTAIYKRVYRGLKTEFTLLFDNISRYATEATQQEYSELLDDPSANLEQDFNRADMDISPVSDPSSVTQMQRLARAQFVLSTVPTLQAAGGNVKAALKRVYEAANVDDIDELLPEPGPEAAMAQQLQMQAMQVQIKEKDAKAQKDQASAIATLQNVGISAGELELDKEKAAYEAVKDGMGMGMNDAGQ